MLHQPPLTAPAPPVTGRAPALRALRSVTVERRELPTAIDPLAVFATAGTLARAYWAAPADDVEFCAIGSAFEIEAAPGPNRFDTVADALNSLEVVVTGDEQAEADADLGPLLIGGFAFSDSEDAAAGDWSPFGGGRLTLPEILVTRSGNRTWLTATPGSNLWPVVAASRHGAPNACATCGLADGSGTCGLASGETSGAGSGTMPACDRSASDTERTMSSGPGSSGLGSSGLGSSHLDSVDLGEFALPDTGSPRAAAAGYRTDDCYTTLVERALGAIASGSLDKVVTARELRLDAHVEPVAVLGRLRQRYPSCVTFAIGRGSQTFFGATPERLVRSDGERVHTDALAGSRPRHPDPHRDAQLSTELASDPKELAEHAMVVSDVRDALEAAGVTLDVAEPTGIMPLRRITHLHTPISGRLNHPTTVLELVRALHPTAAVAGLPRRDALDWIDDYEGIDRGWYAGPVGWTTPDGRGEFRVALRCALAGPRGASLFAGGGIVAGANPSAELAETSTKLEALLCALDRD